MNEKTAPLIAASILSSDLGVMRQEIQSLESAGCDLIHLDVMDGNFVPEISFGANMAELCKKESKLPVEAHLMVRDPGKHFDRFIAAGATRIIFHYEATNHAHRLCQELRSQSISPGIALNPATPITAVEDLLEVADMVLLMSVNPGWGGQQYIQHTNDKVAALRTRLSERGLSQVLIEIDGGINAHTATPVVKAGADVLVSGSFLTKSNDKKSAIAQLKSLA